MTQAHSTPPQGLMTPQRALLALSTVALGWLSGCSLPPSAPSAPSASSAPKAPTATTAPSSAPAATHQAPSTNAPQTVLQPSVPSAAVPKRSNARNASEYRKDAAKHLYARHSPQIFEGRLPPMLKAVGVLNVDIDRHGAVKSIHWQRAPRHAPQVMREIERLVKAAAPYPAPQHMGQVTYTDVWLWHQSGRFQLDTLTEGQD